MKQARTSSSPPNVPHSWAIDEWPPHVFPGSPAKARYLVRTHKTELIAAGALVRVGRSLVAIGTAYSRWLGAKSGDVLTYECPINGHGNTKRWSAGSRRY